MICGINSWWAGQITQLRQDHFRMKIGWDEFALFCFLPSRSFESSADSRPVSAFVSFINYLFWVSFIWLSLSSWYKILENILTLELSNFCSVLNLSNAFITLKIDKLFFHWFVWFLNKSISISDIVMIWLNHDHHHSRMILSVIEFNE